MIAFVAGHVNAVAATGRGGTARTARRQSQRERILTAAGELLASVGFKNLTVAQVIERAGVSRPTFYEYFSDKEDCFLAVLAPLRRGLLADVRLALAGAAPECAAATVTERLLAFASADPAAARVLLAEPMTGGRRCLDARDRLVRELSRLIDGSLADARSTTTLPGIEPELLVGVLARLLASRLQSPAPLARGLQGELLEWLSVYRMSGGGRRWSDLAAPRHVGRSPYLTEGPLRPPPRLLPGRPRIPEDAVAENQRQRIMFAAAELVHRNGFDQVTVSDIAALAGVDGRVFYRHFPSKSHALQAMHETLFRHLMAVTAGAFVAGESWPERVWEAARACTQCLEQNDSATYAAFVEGDASDSARGARAFMQAFTIFLQEGYRAQLPGSHLAPRSPAPVELEAIVTAVFELSYRHARDPSERHLAGLVDQIVFLAVAPFLGASQAHEFLTKRVRREEDARRSRDSVRPQRPAGRRRAFALAG
jgi:AcrR family transcriptional regulator